MSKWYGKIIFQNEGVDTYAECNTKEEAEAFCNGFKYAKELTRQDDEVNGDGDSLNDYWTAVDQIKPEDG